MRKIGKVAMTAAERQRRRRARLRPERAYEALERAWAACPKRERTRFLRSLRAASLQRKKERRAQKECDLAAKIDRMNRERALHGDGGRVWLGGLPIGDQSKGDHT